LIRWAALQPQARSPWRTQPWKKTARFRLGLWPLQPPPCGKSPSAALADPSTVAKRWRRAAKIKATAASKTACQSSTLGYPVTCSRKSARRGRVWCGCFRTRQRKRVRPLATRSRTLLIGGGLKPGKAGWGAAALARSARGPAADKWYSRAWYSRAWWRACIPPSFG